MAPQQKHAWFNLAVLAVVVVLYLGLMPVLGPLGAVGAAGLLGLWGLGGLFYRRKPGAVVLDERDEQIRRNSTVIGYSIFWLFFVGGCMIPWGILYAQGRESISVHVLPMYICGGMIVFTVTSSIAVLVQYGRGGQSATPQD